MSYMFYGTESFNQDISGWIIENVQSAENFSEGAISFQDEFKPTQTITIKLD